LDHVYASVVNAPRVSVLRVRLSVLLSRAEPEYAQNVRSVLERARSVCLKRNILQKQAIRMLVQAGLKSTSKGMMMANVDVKSVINLHWYDLRVAKKLIF